MSDNIISPAEFADAQQAAAESEFTYTLKFKQPFEYEGNTYQELFFDWGKLTGTDGLAIEAELRSNGISVLAPALNGEYMVRMAAKACTSKIGYDVLKALPLYYFHRLQRAARSFLMSAGV